jgi:hypothetical protein
MGYTGIRLANHEPGKLRSRAREATYLSDVSYHCQDRLPLHRPLGLILPIARGHLRIGGDDGCDLGIEAHDQVRCVLVGMGLSP